MTVIFGNLQGVFQNYFLGRSTYDDFVGEMGHLVLYFVYLAIGEFVATYLATVSFIYTGEHISAKIREAYLRSCMKQNIGFFDKLGAGEVTTRITADTNLIQEGISEKVSSPSPLLQRSSPLSSLVSSATGSSLSSCRAPSSPWFSSWGEVRLSSSSTPS